MKRLLRVAEAADAMNITSRTLYRMLAAGEIPALKIRGCLRLDAVDIERYILRQKERWIYDNG